jgi:ferritin-like metal-binding protein YciE
VDEILLREVTMQSEKLQEFLVEELKDLYSAEKQITKALPKMMKKAKSNELKKAFEAHLRETEEQIERLETIFEQLDESPRGKKCKGMEGLIEEGQEVMQENADEPEILDVGMIAAAQKVEHYEMAGYGCARTYAELLGLDDIAELLEKTLEEEKATDAKLTGIAEKVNVEAAEEEEAA